MRSLLLQIALLIFAVGTVCPAQDSNFSPKGQQIPVPECLTREGLWQGGSKPCSQREHEAWLADISHWRKERRIRIGYDGARYDLPALQWTHSSLVQPLMMVQDRYFYDPVAGKYTVDRYLDDLQKRYGGIDAVLIWPTYPNMGIDNRNQQDMIRSMPGGVAGVKQMIADFHQRGVRVLFPMMMWDQGTRDPGRPWPDEIASLMEEVGADGINGDTQDSVPLAFSLAADKIGHPLAFEPEEDPSDEALAWNVMTWGQYQFPFTPSVDKYKWLETRHMVNISNRWNRDKTDDLQFAFFNGVDWESWENIWGIWNGITPHDGEVTRRVATIERGIAPFLVSEDWEPMSPMLHYGVYTSVWPLGREAVWTIVNRNEYDVEGDQIEVAAKDNVRYIDLYHGLELKPRAGADGKTVLAFSIESKGYGAILATNAAPDRKVLALMSKMKKLTATPLANYSHEWKVLPEQIVPIDGTKNARSAPAGMVKVPEADFVFKVSGIEIEGSNDIGVDAQYPCGANIGPLAQTQVLATFSERRFGTAPQRMESTG